MDPPQVDSPAEKEDRILDRLDARLGQPFFRDGAVDPAEYCSAPRHTVFVLREVNVTPDEDGGDLRAWLRTLDYRRTWNTVARWTYGLSNGLSAWDALPSMAAGFRMLVLRRVAVVNVNKRGGGSTSDPERVRRGAIESAAELR